MAVKIRKFVLGRIIPNGEDAKVIDVPSEKLALLEALHLGRHKGDETILEGAPAIRELKLGRPVTQPGF